MKNEIVLFEDQNVKLEVNLKTEYKFILAKTLKKGGLPLTPS